MPAETAARARCRRSCAQRGFKFCGPTIVYAFMQATGMVNDHLVDVLPPRGARRTGRAALSRAARHQQDRSAHSESQPPRAWQRMLSGRRLDLLDPSPLDIEIEDIAHGLARVARWNGQTIGAAHLLGRAAFAAGRGAVAPPPLRRGATSGSRSPSLLHDAPEYVIGDMISPFKAVIGDDYKAVEKRLLAAIHRPLRPAARAAGRSRQGWIKAADRGRRLSRGDALAGFTAAEARRFFGAAGTADRRICRLSRPDPSAGGGRAFPRSFRRTRRGGARP